MRFELTALIGGDYQSGAKSAYPPFVQGFCHSYGFHVLYRVCFELPCISVNARKAVSVAIWQCHFYDIDMHMLKTPCMLELAWWSRYMSCYLDFWHGIHVFVHSRQSFLKPGDMNRLLANFAVLLRPGCESWCTVWNAALLKGFMTKDLTASVDTSQYRFNEFRKISELVYASSKNFV